MSDLRGAQRSDHGPLQHGDPWLLIRLGDRETTRRGLNLV